MLHISMANKLVFPIAAFPEKKIIYSIDTRNALKEREKIKLNSLNEQKGAAFCKGLGPKHRLPQRTCLTLFKGHDEICRLMNGGEDKIYPLVQNGQFLGICGCD